MKTQVAVVQVAETAVALFVRGSFVADNSGSFTGADIEQLANNTASALGAKPTFLSHTPAELSFPLDWESIGQALKAELSLQGGLKEYALTYDYLTHNGEAGTETAIFQAENLNHALEQLYSEVATLALSIMEIHDLDRFDEEYAAITQTCETDFQLTPVVGDKVEITVADLSVELYQRDGSIEINVYEMSNLGGAPITTYTMPTGNN